jgi:hypothetical protein
MPYAIEVWYSPSPRLWDGEYIPVVSFPGLRDIYDARVAAALYLSGVLVDHPRSFEPMGSRFMGLASAAINAQYLHEGPRAGEPGPGRTYYNGDSRLYFRRVKY